MLPVPRRCTVPRLCRYTAKVTGTYKDAYRMHINCRVHVTLGSVLAANG
jgi:hypothetical protein